MATSDTGETADAARSAELRKRYQAYVRECERVSRENADRHARFMAAHEAGRYQPFEGMLSNPSLPEAFRGLACGARTRKGGACKRTDIYRNGRCKFHGGLSTGPKTSEGRARALSNLIGRHRTP